MKLVQLVLFLLLAGTMAGCGEKQSPPAPTAAAAPQAAPGTTNLAPVTAPATNQSFLVQGIVKKVDQDGKRVTSQHESIQGYMDAMTMPFRVKDGREIEGLQPGDSIWFRLWVAPDESWIDRVRKVKEQAQQAAPTAPPEPEGFRVVRDVEPLKVGDLMPDYHFTNELGQAVNLSDFKGQALAFTFIFTRCPLPDFCPRMSKQFSEVSQKLLHMSKGPTNWHLFSISFDPHFDTPEVLRGYAQAFQNDPKHWNFLTGAMIDIDAITDQFELVIIRRGSDWEHKLRTVVVDASGHVQNIIYGNEWKPDALVESIVKAASVKPPEAMPAPNSAQQ
jgi:protein SCO1/2